MSYLDNQPTSGVTDGSDINSNVFTANSVTVNGDVSATNVNATVGNIATVVSANVNAGAVYANSVSIVDGDFAITATNADPDQTNAYAITKDYNVVSVSAGHGDAVRLPAPIVGRLVTIVNNGAKDVGVYPSADCAIDTFGTNAAYYLASGSCQRFVAVSTTKWTRLNRARRFVSKAAIGDPSDYHINASSAVPSDWIARDNSFHQINFATYLPPSSYVTTGGTLRLRLYSDTGVVMDVRSNTFNDHALRSTGATNISSIPGVGISVGPNALFDVKIASAAGAQQINIDAYDVEG